MYEYEYCQSICLKHSPFALISDTLDSYVDELLQNIIYGVLTYKLYTCTTLAIVWILNIIKVTDITISIIN